MFPFFDRYYRSIHQIADTDAWLTLCASESDRFALIDLLDALNARAYHEARQCFLDGIQLGCLLPRQAPDGL